MIDYIILKAYEKDMNLTNMLNSEINNKAIHKHVRNLYLIALYLRHKVLLERLEFYYNLEGANKSNKSNKGNWNKILDKKEAEKLINAIDTDFGSVIDYYGIYSYKSSYNNSAIPLGIKRNIKTEIKDYDKLTKSDIEKFLNKQINKESKIYENTTLNTNRNIGTSPNVSNQSTFIKPSGSFGKVKKLNASKYTVFGSFK